MSFLKRNWQPGLQANNWLEKPSTRDWFIQTISNTYPPPFSSLERDVLKRVIEDEKEKIEKLEKQIETLEEQIQESKALIQRTKVQISPVRLLPPEILSHIFLLVAGKNFSFKEYPCTLEPMLVCRTWRDVAISTPELWSKFAVYDHPLVCGRKSQKRLELWLSRAKDVPLHITYNASAVPSSRSAWPLLLDHANTWGGLEFSGTSLVPIQQYFNSLNGQSVLEMLDLNLFDLSTSLDFSGTISFPKLSTISINGSNIMLKAFQRFQAPHVQELKMSGVFLSGNNLAMVSTAFPRLRKLILESVSDARWERCESPTTKPELHTPDLEYCFLSSELKQLAPIFDPLIFRHCTSLQTLSLSGTRFRACQRIVLSSVLKLNYVLGDPLSLEQSREFFAIFPSLKQLTLSYPDLVKNQVEPMLLSLGPSLEPDSLQLCPNLEKITFDDLWIDRSTLITFMETQQPKLLITVKDCRGVPDMSSVDRMELLRIPETDFDDNYYYDSGDDYCSDTYGNFSDFD